MNRVRAICVAGVFISAMAGCERDKTPPPIAPQTPATSPTDSGVIPQAQLDTLNKAKAIEGTLMQSDQQRREQDQ